MQCKRRKRIACNKLVILRSDGRDYINGEKEGLKAKIISIVIFSAFIFLIFLYAYKMNEHITRGLQTNDGKELIGI